MAEMFTLAQFLEHHNQPAALLGPDGEQVPLPLEVYRTLRKVVDAMSKGDAITVAPVHQMLTTQEAAELLGVSRPTLVKLLESGEIAFERTSSGRHRRVRLVEVLSYRRRARAEREAALDTLMQTDNELGLIDSLPEDYSEALREARTRASN